MTNPEQESFDLDEDLFAFDAVARELAEENERDESLEEIFASHRDEDVRPAHAADELAGTSGTGGTVYDEPADLQPELDEAPGLAAAASTHERSPANVASARSAPAGSVRPSARARAGPAPGRETIDPAPGIAARLPKGMVAIAVSVTLLNALLGIVLLRGNARMRDEVRAVGNEPSAEVELAQAAHAPLAPPAPEPGALFDAQAHPAFVEARDEIARGEYAAARQRIYSLLAIIDRLEDPRREAVEAEAQFVLAQTLHLEALERMGTAR